MASSEWGNEEVDLPPGAPVDIKLTSDAQRFFTKDSGERQDFDTGARRDVQTGKPRFDLIPTVSLTRLANLYAAGAEKYGDNNWQKGMPVSRCYASAFRHLIQWAEGDRDEDHAAAVAWNMFAIMHYEDTMPELNDMEWANEPS